MKLYYYDGPIMMFGRCISNQWHGETYAKSEKKAKSNLAYRFKQQYGYGKNTQITLPNKLKTEEE